MNTKFYIQRPKDFNYQECLRFLQRSDLECLFKVENGVVLFPLEIKNQEFIIRLLEKNGRLHFEILKGELTSFSKKVIKDYALEWLDVNKDLNGFYKLAQKDKLLQPLAKKFKGLRLIGVPSFLEAISWAIIGQQINLTFAYSLKKRLVENFGKTIKFENHVFYLFPTAEKIASLKEEDLRPLQFSRSKIKYLTGVAQAIVDDEISKTQLAKMPYDEAKAKLIELKGVGNWTADYVLMKSFRFPDAFPISDVGVHNAVKFQLGMDRKPTLEELEKMSIGWEGWKGYATFYLWHSLLIKN